jgi:tetratricopeptide (TPR) repeat protein
MHEKNFKDKIVETAVEQWKVVAAILGVAIVAGAGLGLWNESRARKDRAATNLLYESQISARKALEAKNFEEAEKALFPVVEKFRGTRAAFEAELQMGDLWMDAGKYEKAVAHYRNASGMASDSFSRLLATYTIGIARESEGKCEDAVKAYEEALALQGSDFLKPELMMAQARCFEALKQDKKAIEIYKLVQEKYATRAYYSGAASAYEKQLSSKTL